MPTIVIILLLISSVLISFALVDIRSLAKSKVFMKLFGSKNIRPIVDSILYSLKIEKDKWEEDKKYILTRNTLHHKGKNIYLSYCEILGTCELRANSNAKSKINLNAYEEQALYNRAKSVMDEKRVRAVKAKEETAERLIAAKLGGDDEIMVDHMLKDKE